MKEDGEDTIANSTLYSNEEEEEHISLITTVVEECLSQPQEVHVLLGCGY